MLTNIQKKYRYSIYFISTDYKYDVVSLVTAIMASSILKSMAGNVESTKDKKLYGELMAHSK